MMDTNTDDVISPLKTLTSDNEMDIDEVDVLPSGFDDRKQIVINSDYDDGDESDTTLLGDNFEVRSRRPVVQTVDPKT